MIRYIALSCTVKERTQYGIAALPDSGDSGMMIQINDIAGSIEEAARLATMLQENGVAAEHFKDVVEDYLAMR